MNTTKLVTTNLVTTKLVTTNLVTTNLVKNYGIMFLRKGTKLYHTSEEDKLFNTNISDIKFLFCSFHPYDYGFNSKYVYIIELKKT